MQILKRRGDIMAFENFDEELWTSMLKSIPFNCLCEWTIILVGKINNPGFIESHKHAVDALIKKVADNYYKFNEPKFRKKNRHHWLPYYEQNKTLPDNELKENLMNVNDQICAKIIIGFLVEGTEEEVAKIKKCFFEINPQFTAGADIETKGDNTENNIPLNKNAITKKMEALELKLQKKESALSRAETLNKELEAKKKQQAQYLKEKAISIKKIEAENKILQNTNDNLQEQNEKLSKENGMLQIMINEYKDHIASLDYQLKSFRDNLFEQQSQKVIRKNASNALKIGLWKMICEKDTDSSLEMIPISSEMTKDDKALNLLFSTINEIWYLPEKINRFEINKITNILGSIDPAPELVQINNQTCNQYTLSEDNQ